MLKNIITILLLILFFAAAEHSIRDGRENNDKQSSIWGAFLFIASGILTYNFILKSFIT